METIRITCAGLNVQNKWTRCDDLVTKVIIPKFSSYSNLTYKGTAVSGSFSEATFQIGSNLNYYLKIGRLQNKGITDGSNTLNVAIGTSENLSVAGTYLDNSITNPRVSWSGTNESIGNFMMYAISDVNDNLKVIWNFNQSFGSKEISSPIIFTKSYKNRDIIIIFKSVSGTNNDAPVVYFMDDSLRNKFYLNANYQVFDSDTEVLRITGIPIVSSESGNGIVDFVSSEFTQIINTSIGALNDSSNNSTYKNGGGYVRKLIRIGSKYYRQLTTNWWFEDPKGDEPSSYIDENTYPSS